MRVLVVGNGAREHAIARKVHSDGAELISAMAKGNPGMASISARSEVFDILNPGEYARFKGLDLAIIGPEAALAAGVSDALEAMGVPVVGPRKALARIEWSKSFARELIADAGIPGNPEFKVAHSAQEAKLFLADHPDVAVKPDVLTGGKGVRLTGDQLATRADAEAYAAECIRNDGLVVLEEKLAGKEFTLQAFVDGRRVEVMPMIRDYKRAYDGDRGPNTGSMGSFSCPDHRLPDVGPSAIRDAEEIMKKTVNALRSSVGDYKGFLYGGFMETDRGVYLIEYNSRLGDPEAINVLALLDSSLLNLGEQIVDGNLGKPNFRHEATVCVYVAPEGYPDSPKKDQPITVGEMAHSEPYYASVYEEGGALRTTGSRSVAVLARGATVAEARSRAYADVRAVKGPVFYRTDIAAGV